MHQQRPTSKPGNGSNANIPTHMVFTLRLRLAIGYALRLVLWLTSILTSRLTSISVLLLAGVVEGAFASLLVDEEPTLITGVPLCDPGRRHLWRAVVVLVLRRVMILVVEEIHLAGLLITDV